MIKHAEYDSAYPLPYFGASPLSAQIEAYANQQEWIPEQPTKRRPRISRDDLRRTKCIIRYREQFTKGPITVVHLCRAFGIQRQSVNLKIKEYLALGYVERVGNHYFKWIGNDNEL